MLLTAGLASSSSPCPLTRHITRAPLLPIHLQGPWGGGRTCGTISPLQFVCSLGPPPPTAKAHTHLSLQHHEKHLLSLKVCNLWFAPVPSFSKVRLRIEVTFRAMQPVRSHRCGHLRLPPLPRTCQLNRKLASWALRPSVIQPLWFIRVMKAWPQLSLY